MRFLLLGISSSRGDSAFNQHMLLGMGSLQEAVTVS